MRRTGKALLKIIVVLVIVLALGGVAAICLKNFNPKETLDTVISSFTSYTAELNGGKQIRSDVTEAIDNITEYLPSIIPDNTDGSSEGTSASIGNDDIVEGYTYKYLNDNKPEFDVSDYTVEPFEKYSKLDSLGRCGVAYANICEDLMPESEREEQLTVKPSGWKVAVYEDLIDNGGYLYNRCHLIGYFLAGENDNELNLITGTRYFNTEGMLPFEIEVGNYVERTGNHVLYRVTPVYTGDNLVADGVQMEAYSVEDHGKGVCYNVFVYNVQPGIEIDYATGDSWEER